MECEGLFYTGPDLSQTVRVGIVLFESRENRISPEEARLARLYVNNPHCTCRREEPSGPGSWPSMRDSGRPPSLPHDEMKKLIEEMLSRKPLIQRKPDSGDEGSDT